MRRVVRTTAVAALLAASASTGGTAQAAGGDGLLRLAHLSPDTPEVDVYVDSVADPDVGAVLRGVGYGALSAYQDVPPGQYTVSMRAAGAAESEPPVLSTTVDVGQETAWTVAGVGLFAEIDLAIIEDALDPPRSGGARVRVLAGASNAETLDVALDDGTEVASELAFATAGEYVDVPAGRTPLRIAAGGGEPTDLSVDLDAGSVYSLVVLDEDDGLTVEPVLDAASPGVVPQGGVEAGAGGTAGSGLPAGAALGACTAMVAGGALVVRAARARPRHTATRR
jgi:hypothetical protein